MVEYNLKDFILEFFKNCKIINEKEVLTISEVQKDFEDFIGKKSPYQFVFDLNAHTKIKDSELITPGSYFLVAIKDYLSYKGLTSLVKLEVKPEVLEIDKIPLFRGSKILKVETEKYIFLPEFSFLSIYQYLNEKRQSIIKFLINNKELLNFDKLKTSNGNINDLPELNLEKEYALAKRDLDIQVNKETKAIKALLITKLHKELERIKGHYYKQIKEKDEELEKCQEKIKLLENKLKHTYYSRDINILKRMIRESEARFEMLKKKSYKERLHAEEIFHIKDEVEKHVLSVKNNLINITIYYYPLWKICCLIKGKERFKLYDPVLKKVIIKE